MLMRICVSVNTVPLKLREYSSCFYSSFNPFNSHLILKQKPNHIKIIYTNNNTCKFITPTLFICLSSMADSNPRVSLQNDGSVDPNCTEIIVVRHGETDWNAVGKMQGQLDVDLNELGRQQAVAVAERLSREPKISAIYSSDLKRAFETAKAIASKCGGLEVITDQDLRERHLGDLQGCRNHELASLTPKAYGAFKSSRTDQKIPGGGESLDQLFKRCTSSLQRIGERHRGQRVVVVSHGGAIRTLYSRAATKGQRAGKILNTSVSVFLLSEGDKWSIKSWTDVSHLRQTEVLQSGFGGDASSG